MLRVTEIVFGLEKIWRHHNKDCRLIPCHICIIPLIAGILNGSNIVRMKMPAIILFLIATILLIIASLLHKAIRHPKRHHRITWMLSWCILWFNLGFYTGNAHIPPTPPINETCTIEGTILETQPGTKLVTASISHYQCPSSPENIELRIQIPLDCQDTCYRGLEFQTTGEFEPILPPDAPGMFNAQSWARANDIHGKFRITGKTQYNPTEPGLRAKLEIARNKAFQTLSEKSPNGITTALILGTSKKITPQTRNDFSRLGIAHLLAVSGLHFGTVALIIIFLCNKAVSISPFLMRRFGKNRLATLLSFPALAIYLLFVGVPISAQRALIMTVTCASARILSRKPCRTRALATAGILILIHDPLAVYAISFQLSFSAVLGILWGMDFYETKIRLKILSLYIKPWLKKAIAMTASMLIMTISTSLTTAPFVIYHFGQLPLLGILANIPAIPYVTFILMPVAIITSLFLMIGLPGADLVCSLAAYCENILTYFASLLNEHLPAACLDLPPHPILITGAIFTAFCLLFQFRPNQLRTALAAIASLFMAVLLIISTVHPRLWTRPDGLRISFVSMGQADATLIEFPNGHIMLIDIGSELQRHDNAADTHMIPFLKYNMISHIDILVLTHSDYDHIAGLVPLLNSCSIGEVWFNGRNADSKYTPVIEHGIPLIPVTTLPSHQTIQDGSIDILWPNDKFISQSPEFLSENESSVVIALHYGNFSALFMGDAGISTEDELLAQHDIHNITVLKAGHHGSNSASSQEWVEKTNPQFTIFSVGKKNRYKFPHADVQRRFIQNRTRMLRTDIHGTIRMTTDGNHIHIETMRY